MRCAILPSIRTAGKLQRTGGLCGAGCTSLDLRPLKHHLKDVGGSLADLPFLESLWIAMSKKLKVLPQNTLRAMKSLTFLDLHANGVASLHGDLFKNNGTELSQLKWLSLSGNKLKSLPEGIFDGLTSLEHLDLPNNQIEYFHPHAFDAFAPSLKHLRFHNNNIDAPLPPSLLSGLTALTMLDMRGNGANMCYAAGSIPPGVPVIGGHVCETVQTGHGTGSGGGNGAGQPGDDGDDNDKKPTSGKKKTGKWGKKKSNGKGWGAAKEKASSWWQKKILGRRRLQGEMQTSADAPAPAPRFEDVDNLPYDELADGPEDATLLKRCMEASSRGWSFMPAECRGETAGADESIAAAANLTVTHNGTEISVEQAIVGGRVVGGNGADISWFPYQLSLLKANFRICGASLIAPDWALTAAHCLPEAMADPAGASSLYRVVYGSTDVALGLGEGKVVSVQAVVIHPDFVADTLESDVALLKLQFEVPIGSGSGATTIPLAGSGEDAQLGQDAYVSGWGTTQEDCDSCSPVNLHYAAVDIRAGADEATCVAYSTSKFNPRTMLCAGCADGSKDACQGDSGGPLAVNGAGGHPLLVGIVSWGIGCGRQFFPGVYTRVSTFSPWIQEVTASAAVVSSRCNENPQLDLDCFAAAPVPWSPVNADENPCGAGLDLGPPGPPPPPGPCSTSCDGIGAGQDDIDTPCYCDSTCVDFDDCCDDGASNTQHLRLSLSATRTALFVFQRAR